MPRKVKITTENAVLPSKDARSRLDPTRLAAADKIASTAPKHAVAQYFASLAGKSRKAAMKVTCWQCCGWERREVRLCTAKGCPLWAWRPFQQEAADE